MRSHIGLYSCFGIKDVLTDLHTMLSIFADELRVSLFYNVSSFRLGSPCRHLGRKLAHPREQYKHIAGSGRPAAV